MDNITEEVVEFLRKSENKKVRKRTERVAQAIKILKENGFKQSVENIEIVTRRLGSIEKRLLLGFPFDISLLEDLEK